VTNPTPRILLTGLGGQLGCELNATLAPLGEITAVDRLALDLTRPEQIRQVIRDIKPALIINAAAYTAVDRAEDEPDIAAAVNAIAPGIMAECAQSLGATLIHFSTDYVFDGTAAQPYLPDAPTSPINTYGKTKLEGERAIVASGAAHIIIRTSWVYAMTGRNFVLAILNKAKRGEPLRVVNDQHGSPTWAHDLAMGAAAIAAHALTNKACPQGVYHLTGSGITTWYDFACAIVEHADLDRKPDITPVPSTAFPTRAKRPAYSGLDGTSTQRDFGVTLPDWRQSLKRALQSQRV